MSPSTFAHAAPTQAPSAGSLEPRDRLVRLQEVTAALSAAATIEDVGDVATRLGAKAVGASSARLWLRGVSGELTLARSAGPEVEAEPTPKPWPELRVLEGGTTVWLEPRPTASGDESAASATLPIRAHGRTLGVLSFRFEEGHRFDDEERAFIETLNVQCAQALDRARLLAEAHDRERQLGELADAERSAREQAIAAMRVRDEFLATVSHELRTPLNAIVGWIQILRSGTLPEDRRAHALNVIDRNARAQEQLISDLLDVSRVVTGRLRLDVHDVSIQEVVDMAVEVVRPAADGRGITLRVDLQADAPPVMGDSDRLQQVFWNLLNNAIKFTPQGGTIDVKLRVELPHVVVSVTDTGAGLAPEMLEYVFQPFRQADASFARRQKGLGLGLAITRSLVEMHAGVVEAHSEGQGKGSTFVVRLPVSTLRPEATPRVPAFTQPSNRPLPPQRSLRGICVLVVEDEPDSRELLVSLLEQQHATVLAAASAAEALDKLTLASPDVLLSDVGLPGEDGLSLIRRVRATPSGATMPAIALTAFVSDADRDRAIEAGFDAHVAKPIDPDVLLRALTDLVDERGRATPSVVS